MFARAGDDRIEVLARRMRWLERYRRWIAFGVAVALAPLIMTRLTSVLGKDWPGVHTWALTFVASVVAWAILEISLAWITAVLETQHARLSGRPTLPRAQLLVRKLRRK